VDSPIERLSSTSRRPAFLLHCFDKLR
jgi:hypothetical protein